MSEPVVSFSFFFTLALEEAVWRRWLMLQSVPTASGLPVSRASVCRRGQSEIRAEAAGNANCDEWGAMHGNQGQCEDKRF